MTIKSIGDSPDLPIYRKIQKERIMMSNTKLTFICHECQSLRRISVNFSEATDVTNENH